MIAIIPARGGSKGLPGKNIKKLNGIPLIAYTVRAALKSACLERVIVSTDSSEIAGAAEEAGAEIPFLRPDYLSTDTASAIDVYIHAVEYLNNSGNGNIRKFMVLLPTAPFRNEKHIDEAFELFRDSGCDTLISVKNAPVPPEWYLSRDDSGFIKPCGFGLSAGIVKNRQESSRYYIPNGAIYILDYGLLVEKRTYYTDKTACYVMEEADSIDIDTQEDFDYAEYVLKTK